MIIEGNVLLIGRPSIYINGQKTIYYLYSQIMGRYSD